MKRKNFVILFIFFMIIFIALGAGVTYSVTPYLYNSNVIGYDNLNSGLSSTDVQGALDELYNSCSVKDLCPENSDYVCYHKTTKNGVVSPGDYISYKPTKTSVNTHTSRTGYSQTQTFNPSELTLWRVFKVNDDGTIEIISNNVSSASIYFDGDTGWYNYVGELNEFAQGYEDDGKFTVTGAARHVGYNGQVEYITDTSNVVQYNDTLYESDVNLMEQLNIKATYVVGTQTYAGYFIASRYIYQNYGNNHLYFRYMTVGVYNRFNLDDGDGAIDYHLRPIVLLKPGLEFTGDGSGNSPWVIQE